MRGLLLVVAAAATQPNVVLFLADDLDVELGGLTPLAQARALLQDQGTTLVNAFAHTPICCPSRAELLTGKYWHNLRVASYEDSGCMHVRSTGANEQWFNERLFLGPLQRAGYAIGYFGKYLNTMPAGPPPTVAFDAWLANNGGAYFEPSFQTGNGTSATFDNGTYANYSTAVLGNVSAAWVARRAADASAGPFFAVVAPKAPQRVDALPTLPLRTTRCSASGRSRLQSR